MVCARGIWRWIFPERLSLNSFWRLLRSCTININMNHNSPHSNTPTTITIQRVALNGSVTTFHIQSHMRTLNVGLLASITKSQDVWTQSSRGWMDLESTPAHRDVYLVKHSMAIKLHERWRIETVVFLSADVIKVVRMDKIIEQSIKKHMQWSTDVNYVFMLVYSPWVSFKHLLTLELRWFYAVNQQSHKLIGAPNEFRGVTWSADSNFEPRNHLHPQENYVT